MKTAIKLYDAEGRLITDGPSQHELAARLRFGDVDNLREDRTPIKTHLKRMVTRLCEHILAELNRHDERVRALRGGVKDHRVQIVTDREAWRVDRYGNSIRRMTRPTTKIEDDEDFGDDKR